MAGSEWCRRVSDWTGFLPESWRIFYVYLRVTLSQSMLLLFTLLSAHRTMTSYPREMTSLHPDVLRLVFDRLEGNAVCNVGLTCHAWRSMSLPSMYRNVDLSYHNISDTGFDIDGGGDKDDNKAVQRYVNGKNVYTDFLASVRPVNMVHRQRAFLRTITAHPKLATYVKSLTWTLVWKDRANFGLTEIDRQTWNVFGQMNNVTSLDLASLHNIHKDDFVRQSPTQLFPAVINLRLVGWMHRGLIKAIFASINTARLRSLTLDYAQDEGALPDGSPMGVEFAKWCSSEMGDAMGDPAVISQTLLDRQESGKAFIFPGPMWLPLHILSTARLDSLTHLRVDVPPLSFQVNGQGYVTLFQKTADLLRAVSASLRSLTIILGEAQSLPDGAGIRCGTGHMRLWERYSPWCLKMTSSYLYQLVTVLSEHPFPQLKHIRFEGFNRVEAAGDARAQARNIERAFDPIQAAAVARAQAPDIECTLEATRKCPFAATASFTEILSKNERPIFNGYINQAFPGHPDDWEKEFEDMLNASYQVAV